jgi:hypothetical protein
VITCSALIRPAPPKYARVSEPVDHLSHRERDIPALAVLLAAFPRR